MTVMTVNVASVTLDAQCKKTLATMLANGWCIANTPYQSTQQVLSEAELSHLLRHGGVVGPSGPIATIKSFVAPKFGPGAGVDVAFRLNVNLA
jgi:hypothetical protein